MRRASFVVAVTLAMAGAAGLSCSSARHRKVSGPPPEYELPDDGDASPAAPSAAPSPAPRDAGAQ